MERQEAPPFNVTLLVKDGKELKAHRDVLSEASLFFEKLLESDMKESNEGVIRLEVFTELLMKEILKFIYTSDVQISSEENARELIMAGDYLFLPKLKTIAGRFLEHSMTVSCCISTYYFAETYRCDELVARARTFVQYNFALLVKCEEFLNLTDSQQVEEWLSDDEIVIHEEEDVFNVIIAWIRNEEKTRSEKFEELFRHVRLIFVSREFLQRELLAQDLVKQNDPCMNRVKQAMNWIDRSDDFLGDPPSPKSPRKRFESDVLVVHGRNIASLACYVPGEGRWYGLKETMSRRKIILYGGNLYAISTFLNEGERYDPLLNKWLPLEWAKPESVILEALSRAHTSLDLHVVGHFLYAIVTCANMKLTFLKCSLLELSHWRCLSWSDLVAKEDVCIVATDKHIYVPVGGLTEGLPKFKLNTAARFDTVNDAWEKIEEMQEARNAAFGASVNGKIYIAGGSEKCEMYNEATKKWYNMASLNVPRQFGSMVCVDGTLYVLGGFTSMLDASVFKRTQVTVEYYDCQNDEWRWRTNISISVPEKDECEVYFNEFEACSMRLCLKGSRPYTRVLAESSEKRARKKVRIV